MFAEAISLESVARGTDTARDGPEALKSSDSALKGQIMLREWQVKRTAHEQKEIPRFFQEIWAKKKGENPLDNQERYDQLRTRSFNWGFGGGSCAFVFGLVLGVVASALRISQSVQPVTLMLCGMMIGVVSSVVCMVIAHCVSPKRQKGQWHFEEYYGRLFALFHLFGIEPNEVIGKLSREEFVKSITEELRRALERSDANQGFARLSYRKDFERMHAAALEWGLCLPTYGKYDSKKV